MATPVFDKLDGTSEQAFHIGNAGGPVINNNSGTLEAKNAANTALINVNVALPTQPNHAVNKQYADNIAKLSLTVSQQFNGNNALPGNTSTEQWYVVTTTGPQASIGQLVWDNGTNTGTTTVIPASTGQLIFTTTAFTGGTIALPSSNLYNWTGSVWMAAIPSVAGATLMIVTPLTYGSATIESATNIPANAYIASSRVVITTAFSAGTTISIGQTGSASLLLGTGDNVATVVGEYQSGATVPWGSSALPLLATFAGSPTAGAGYMMTLCAVPNA
jgi:hypothetical protein